MSEDGKIDQDSHSKERDDDDDATPYQHDWILQTLSQFLPNSTPYIHE